MSAAYRINDIGMVIGESYINGDTALHAFLLADGSMQDIGTLGGGTSAAGDINGDGVVVGGACLSDNNSNHAFLFHEGGRMVDLGTLGGASRAYGINKAGHIVGISKTIQRSGKEGPYRAFLWVPARGSR